MFEFLRCIVWVPVERNDKNTEIPRSFGGTGRDQNRARLGRDGQDTAGLQEPIVDFSQDDTLHLLPCLVRKASRMLCRLQFPWPVSFAFPPPPPPTCSLHSQPHHLGHLRKITVRVSSQFTPCNLPEVRTSPLHPCDHLAAVYVTTEPVQNVKKDSKEF